MPEYNQPAEGAEDWHVPLNENWSDLAIEVTEEVATWSNLPAAGSTSQSSNGQWPVYRVQEDSVFVRVSDSAREIVSGLGSERHPLPEQHTEKLRIGPLDRPETTTEEKTVNTSSYNSLQDTVNQEWAKWTDHKIVINVDTDVSTEDLILPSAHSRQLKDGQPSDYSGTLIINGDTSSPVPLGSLYGSGIWGTNVKIKGFELQNATPYDSDSSDWAATIKRSRQVSFIDCALANGIANGIQSYGSVVNLNGVDFGTNNVSGDGVMTKHGGTVIEQNGESASGNVGGYAYVPDLGTIHRSDDSTLTGDDGFRSPNLGGQIIGRESGAVWTNGDVPNSSKWVRTKATISSCAITVDESGNYYRLDGSISSTLTTINNGIQDSEIRLTTQGTNITVDSGADNIKLNGDSNRTLSSPADVLELYYDGFNWIETSFANNS